MSDLPSFADDICFYCATHVLSTLNIKGIKIFSGPLKLRGAWGHREDASWLSLKRQSPLITRSLIEEVVRAGSASDSDSES